VKVYFASACLVLLAVLVAANPVSAQEDEIVANLAGGRAIIHVAGNDTILFGAIEHPLEAKSVPPRVATLDNRHVGIFFGASEWQIPAQPRPIRIDLDIPRFAPFDPSLMPTGETEQDLEQIGVAFLEKLRPLVAQLHHPIELKSDEPLFQIVLVGFAPQYYGPEVWLIDYPVEQSAVGSRDDYLQTRLLRPRFTQLYPPEKGRPKTLIEVRVPPDLPDIPLLGLIQQNAPPIARLRMSDQHMSKVMEQLQRGEAQKANPTDAANFLRAALPIMAGNASFILGSINETAGFQWIVPPEEPREKEKEKTAEDKNRPADAPTLMRKPKP